MKKDRYTSSAFTLIELIVAITIFGLIMISVMSIFILSSQMSGKIELTRVMQENMKNALEDIAESVRKGDITDVVNTPNACGSFSEGIWNKLCIWNINASEVRYTLWNKNALWDWSPLTDPSICIDNYAETSDSICRILKKTASGDFIPLTNSLVAFEKLEFSLHNTDIPRVTITLTIRPAYGRGVTPQFVKMSKMYIQTTLSERAIVTE